MFNSFFKRHQHTHISNALPWRFEVMYHQGERPGVGKAMKEATEMKMNMATVDAK